MDRLQSGVVAKLVLLGSVMTAFISPLVIALSYSYNINDIFNKYSWSSSFLDMWVISIVVNILYITCALYYLRKSIIAAVGIVAVVVFIIKASFFQAFYRPIHILTFVFLALSSLISPVYIILFFSPPRAKYDAEYSAALLGDEESQHSTPDKKTRASFKRIMQLAQSETWTLVYATIALIVAAVCTLAQPYFFGKIINACTKDDGQEELNRYTIILLVIFIIGGVFTSIRGWLYSLIVHQDVSFFDTNKTGELMNRLSSDTAVVQSCLSINISIGLRSAAQVVVSTLLLFVTSWKLTLVMFSIVPVLIVGVSIYGRYAKKLSTAYQDALARAGDAGSETIMNSRIMRSFGAETLEYNRYSSAINDAYATGSKKSVAYGYFAGGALFVANVAILIVIYYGAVLVIRGEMSVGSLTTFVFYTIYIAIGLGLLSSLYSDFMNAIGASERIFEILDSEPSIPTSGGGIPESSTGCIEFQDVEFKYPARPDVTVLSHFTLSIQPNTTVALVGPSGSGKSTVLSLLQRFYDISGGSICIDGMDIRTMDPKHLHRIIAIVPQEPVLFSGSIRSNISYSMLANDPCSKGASDVEVEAVARQANAHDFIMGFPDGFDTVVGERGVRLSGGQKQRVAIARALLANPRILLLDEATSALDAESERLVQDAIDKLMQHRTVIVVAHRLSTVKDADMIVMFKQGGIVDTGTHETLLSRCQPYRILVQRQLQWGTEENKD